MKVHQKGTTTLIKIIQENIPSFIEKIIHEQHSFKNQNIIVDLSTLTNCTIKDIKQFENISKLHKKEKKSFVIVVQNIDFNDVPTKISVVPSLLEANDFIEMEEIERDLGF